MTIKLSEPICVLGVIDTPQGHEIASELRGWLSWYYHVHEVWHDGKLFEQPALRYAQQVSIATGQPVLYLHTKGACNHIQRSRLIRKMWRREFVLHRDTYFGAVAGDAPAVACAFTGKDRFTRYNGFVANAAAWAAIPPIEPNENRAVYEYLWRDTPDVKIKGMIYNDIASANLARMHEYLTKEFGL